MSVHEAGLPAQSDGLSREELAVLCHEVRGALTVITGYAELMNRPMPREDRARALDGIARAIRRIDLLLDSALKGTAVEVRGRHRLDLADLAACVVEEKRTLSQRDVRLSASSSPVVIGVPEALERALGNLIDNALKYSLSSSAVEISVAEEGGNGVLAVADRGPGIPAEDRERVLRPFERLELSAPLQGSGLGLTVVDSVARAHGGSVEILDREGGGALVRILLPLDSEPA